MTAVRSAAAHAVSPGGGVIVIGVGSGGTATGRSSHGMSPAGPTTGTPVADGASELCVAAAADGPEVAAGAAGPNLDPMNGRLMTIRTAASAADPTMAEIAGDHRRGAAARSGRRWSTWPGDAGSGILTPA